MIIKFLRGVLIALLLSIGIAAYGTASDLPTKSSYVYKDTYIEDSIKPNYLAADEELPDSPANPRFYL